MRAVVCRSFPPRQCRRISMSALHSCEVVVKDQQLRRDAFDCSILSIKPDAAASSRGPTASCRARRSRPPLASASPHRLRRGHHARSEAVVHDVLADFRNRVSPPPSSEPVAPPRAEGAALGELGAATGEAVRVAVFVRRRRGIVAEMSWINSGGISGGSGSPTRPCGYPTSFDSRRA
jgi:hypothetical protein